MNRRASGTSGRIATAVAFSVVLVACSDDDPDHGLRRIPAGCTVRMPGELYLGVLLPYAGDLANGLGYERGVLVAVDQINRAGGIAGRSLGIVACDSGGDPTTGADLMAKLGEMPEVGAVIGPSLSVVVVGSGAGGRGAAHEATRTKTLLVSPSASSPVIGELDDAGYVFRTTVSDAVQGVILGKIAEREGFARVFVLQAKDDPYTEGIGQTFVDAFDGTGGQVAGRHTFDSDQPDFVDKALAAADRFEPDAILVAAHRVNGAALIRGAGQRTWSSGKTPRWLLPDGMKEGAVVSKVGNNALLEGTLGTNPAAPAGPDYEAFAKAHRAAFNNRRPGVFAANAYDAAYLLAGAMVIAEDPTSGPQLKAALARTQPGPGARKVHPGQWKQMLETLTRDGQANYEGASGNVDFDERGDVQSNIGEWTIEGGVIKDGDNNCWTPEGVPCT